MKIKKREISGTSMGVFVLLISGFLCKILGAFYRLPLTNIIGIEGIGVFQMVMALYSLALVLTCGGTTIAMSKLVSDARAKNQYEKINLYIKIGIFISIVIGLVIGFFFILFGKSIAIFQGSVENSSYLTFIIVLPLGGVIAGLRGLFQGYENMTPTAVSQILEQVFKFVFGLSFALFLVKINIYQGVFGAFLGVVLSEVFAGFYLVIMFIKRYKNNSESNLIDYDKKNVYNTYLSAFYKLTFTESIIPFVHAFDGVVVVSRIVLGGFTAMYATKLFGLVSGVVGAILNLPLVLSFAIQNALLPNISFLSNSGDEKKENFIVNLGFITLWFFILPSALGIAAVCVPLYKLFYPKVIGEFLGILSNLTILSGISVILTAIMQYFTMILHAKGYFSYSLIVTIIGGVLKILSTFFLCSIKEINIYGIVLGNIFLALFVCITSLFKIKSILDFEVNFFEVFLPLISAVLMYTLVYNIISLLNISNLLTLIIGIVIGGALYLVINIPTILSLKKYFNGKDNFGGWYE